MKRNFPFHRKTLIADYESRLDTIATQLKTTGATVIWASTTPVTEGGMKDATDADLVQRNEAAARVMQKHGIAIDDLHAFMKPDLAKYQNPKDVHFNGPGYDYLAEEVSRSIGTALLKR